MTLKLTDNHTADHNFMRDGILAESERLATPVDIGGPYHVGDPAHIQEHNRTTAALQKLADVLGIAVQLPPERVLGDTGHKSDHLVWEAALAQIQAGEGWNQAEGGTVTEYSDSRGYRWRCHTFTADGTFTVKTAIRPFRVLVVAGGGGGAGGGPYAGGGGGGGAGGYLSNDSLTLKLGAYPVVVGPGGAGGEGARQGAHNGVAGRQGGNSSIAGIEAVGGGGGEAYQDAGSNGGSGSGSYTGMNNPTPGIAGQGNPGGPGEPGPNAGAGGGGGGAGGPGGPASPGAGKASDITGKEVTYARGGAWGDTAGPEPANSGNGGAGIKYGSPNYGGTGGSGIVVVAYQIAPYNQATGGTVTDYTRNGKRYRAHTFTSSGTLNVQVAAKPFSVAAIGGGAGGLDGLFYMGGGNPGKLTQANTVTLPVGDISVTVGQGGGGGTNADGSGGAGGSGPGGTSSIADITAAGGSGRGTDIGRFQPGVPGPTTDLNGSQVQAGSGGTGGGDCPNGGCPGATGAPGVVIVAYEVGNA